MAPPIAERVIKSRVKLLKNSPFFGTLLFHAQVKESENIPTAATNGQSIFFNKDFSDTLDDETFQGILIHEVLHAALLHVPRMKDISINDPAISNIAADIVVNGICDENNIKAPKKAAKSKKAALVDTSAMTQTSMIDDISSEFDDEAELEAITDLDDEDALSNAEPLDEESDEEVESSFETLEDEDAADDMEDDLEDDMAANKDATEEDDDEGYF
jgi:predicted metal-dependent peptidase